MSSTSLLAPIAVFAATPLGISVLAFAAVALASLAIYFIIKNNEISEPKIPSIVIESCKGDLFLKAKDEDFEYITKHKQNKNQDGSVIPDEYRIDFAFKDKSYYITAKNESGISDNNSCLKINSLAVKNDEGEFKLIDGSDQQLKTLSLGSGENDAKELTIQFQPNSSVKSPEAEQQKNERSLFN
ncbi:hypothetical protein [Wolbachia endosymbiont of Nilaparvata lugens]|uniref:hypothetical protein n=1 Tax=Wolbachia endosymbiont of Nilaparvata lugens TaxID=357143 RepID=UPI001F4F6B24|nr:hypothetical protein [Wolbachia endosymbiont of Nilaparvata lugens]